MGRPPCILLALAGCGRIGFGATPDAGSGSGADAAADAAPDLTCWSAWRAGMPQLTAPAPVTSLNTAGYEDNAFVVADGQTVYFRSDRGGSPDFWYAKLDPASGDFVPAAELMSLSSNGDEGTIQVSPDGRTAYISSTRTPSAGGYDLYVATRPDNADDFAVSSTDVANLETAVNEFDQQVVRGEQRIYFTSGAAAPDLYFADRPAPGAPFAAPTLVPGVNTTASEFDPFVSPDELVILFTSDRDGNRDIFVSRRTSTAVAFDQPEPVTAVNSPTSDDQDLSLTVDGCQLWFARPQPGGPGQTDLYTSQVMH